MLYLIGLGLGDKLDVTLKGYLAIKSSNMVFLEHYTSILTSTTKKELELFYDKKIILADRKMVEEKSDIILNESKNNIISFLVVGDPFCATTHTDLLIRAAKEKNIKCKIIHNTSIMNAVSSCGLQLYSFGQTISIPFWTNKWKPNSFYNKIKLNKSIGLHTLCLLDIKIKEISDENLLKGLNIYDPPRFMDIKTALLQLLEIESNLKQDVLNGNLKCIGLARIGSDDEMIVYATVNQLLNVDFGKPLHSLVIPGKMDCIEEEVLEMYSIKNIKLKNNINKQNNNNNINNVKIKFDDLRWNVQNTNNNNNIKNILNSGLDMFIKYVLNSKINNLNEKEYMNTIKNNIIKDTLNKYNIQNNNKEQTILYNITI